MTLLLRRVTQWGGGGYLLLVIINRIGILIHKDLRVSIILQSAIIIIILLMCNFFSVLIWQEEKRKTEHHWWFKAKVNSVSWRETFVRTYPKLIVVIYKIVATRDMQLS